MKRRTIMTTHLTRREALAGIAATATAPALAQSGGTITLMHGFTPGANVDIVARLAAENLARRIGRTIVVSRVPAPAAPRRLQLSHARRPTPERLRSCREGMRSRRRSTTSCPTTRWRTSPSSAC
jgi:hypothetical protein